MELVIFSNTFALIAMGVTLFLYLLSAVISVMQTVAEANNYGDGSRMLISVLKNVSGVLCIISQLVMFGVFFYIGASSQEQLFALMVCTALSLVISAPRKEKK